MSSEKPLEFSRIKVWLQFIGEKIKGEEAKLIRKVRLTGRCSFVVRRSGSKSQDGLRERLTAHRLSGLNGTPVLPGTWLPHLKWS